MYEDIIRPDVRAFAEAFSASPLARVEDMAPSQARTILAKRRTQSPRAEPELPVIRDLTAPGPAGELKVRLYDARADRGPSTIVIYMHGGGFVMGDLESHHEVCLSIARTLDVPLVAVDYRLAPEHKFPAAYEDALAVARWVSGVGSKTLGRQASGLLLAGDSSGANLATTITRTLIDSPASAPVVSQFLLYPIDLAGRQTASRIEFAEGPFLTRKNIDWLERQYEPARGDPRCDLSVVSPAGMPPTLLVTAGLDPLRDEGRDYAARLVRAGVSVIFQEVVGTIHGFFSLGAAIPSSAGDVARTLAALRLMLNLA